MDISITAPRPRFDVRPAQTFTQWKRIIEDQSEDYIYFRLGKLPTQERKLKKCYVIYKGRIVGYFRIKGFMTVIQGSDDLLSGYYMMLTVASWRDIKHIKARGHRNFRYVEDTDSIMEQAKDVVIAMYEELEKRCQAK